MSVIPTDHQADEADDDVATVPQTPRLRFWQGYPRSHWVWLAVLVVLGIGACVGLYFGVVWAWGAGHDWYDQAAWYTQAIVVELLCSAVLATCLRLFGASWWKWFGIFALIPVVIFGFMARGAFRMVSDAMGR